MTSAGFGKVGEAWAAVAASQWPPEPPSTHRPPFVPEPDWLAASGEARHTLVDTVVLRVLSIWVDGIDAGTVCDGGAVVCGEGSLVGDDGALGEGRDPAAASCDVCGVVCRTLSQVLHAAAVEATL